MKVCSRDTQECTYFYSHDSTPNPDNGRTRIYAHLPPGRYVGSLETEDGEYADKPFSISMGAEVCTGGIQEDDFVETATEFCNNYLFGSLSGGVVVPSSMKKEGDDCVAKMKYGSIGVNCWAGENYMLSFGAWGAFPGESLKAVESGIGRVNNWFGLANFQKSVLIAPLTSPSHMSLKSDLVKEARIVEAVTKLVLKPGVGPVCELLSALTGFSLLTAGALLTVATFTLAASYIRE